MINLIHSRIQQSLLDLGITSWTPVQKTVIPKALSGADLLVSAETGSGKTFAYLIPLLHKMLESPSPKSNTRGIILTPTRELAEQVLSEFNKLSQLTYITAQAVYGGVGFREQAARLRKNPEIIIATPGRIIEHVEKQSLILSDIEILIIDEADRMLDMGFSDEVIKLTHFIADKRQTLLFSATLNPEHLNHLAKIVLKTPQTCILNNPRTTVNSVAQQIITADNDKHKEHILYSLLETETYQRAIVFTNTRIACQHLGNLLRYKKFRAGYIHGELSQPERKKIINLFKNNQINILVATDLASRGLDIKGIDVVINYTVAHSGDDYVHRIGRSGRAENSGLAISLVSPAEWNRMAGIERYLSLNLQTRKIKGLEAHFNGPRKKKAQKNLKKRHDDISQNKNSVRTPRKSSKADNIQSQQSKNKQPKMKIDLGHNPLRKRNQ